MTALAPAEMAINNAVIDGTRLLPAQVIYGMLLTMHVNVLVGVSQLLAAEGFIANWEQITKKVNH